MSIQRVYSKNAAYQKFEVLKTNRNKRYRYNAFFVEGVRNINEAIANGWTIQSFLYCPDRALSHWAQDILHSVRTEVNYELSDALMRELSGCKRQEAVRSDSLLNLISAKPRCSASPICPPATPPRCSPADSCFPARDRRCARGHFRCPRSGCNARTW